MLHTKFHENQPAGSGEDFEGFTYIWAWRLSWSCDQHHINKFSFPCTGLPQYNSPHYNTDFNITRSGLGSQMVGFLLY